MAVVDDFGRVTKLNEDLEALAKSLKAAVGKAVEYAAGKSKESTKDLKDEFDKLTEAMEELGDDVKESLESTRKFVDEVKRAAESMEKAKSSRRDSGVETIAEAQREQTRILQMILRSQQKAASEKAAKFTSGGTVLSSPPQKRSGLKEMGFRPRGADKIPAMVSPNEYIVSRKGAQGNESLLNRINRGYVKGGRVKPQYLSEGSWQDVLKNRNRTGRLQYDFEGNARIIIDGVEDEELKKKIVDDFAGLGKKVSVDFSDNFERGLRGRFAKWTAGLATAITGGSDPWQVLFEGAVKDVTEFRREMRRLAFQVEGITGEFRESQAEFAKIGDDIAKRTGKSVTAFQKAYMTNAQKGFKNQKAGMKVIESGLKMSTLIGSETQATANLFADWHRSLNLSATEMDRMAGSMQVVARNTGVTGDEMLEVMRSSDRILKNLRNQGNLTVTASKNIIQAMAEYKKRGYGDEGEKILSAMSGYSAFSSADDGTRTMLGVAAGMGGVDYNALQFGEVPQDAEKMGKLAGGLKELFAEKIGIDPKNFDMELLTSEQRSELSIVANQFGTTIGAVESTIKTFEKAAAGVAGELSELDKASKSVTATQDQRKQAEKKMNERLLSSSMDMSRSITQAAEKFEGKSLDELAAQLEPSDPTKATKFSQDFESATKDLMATSSYLSDATKSKFGLSGTAEQMSAQIKAMGTKDKMRLMDATAAERLDKALKDKGEGSKNFTRRLEKAYAKGDMAMIGAIKKEMGDVDSKIQVGEATAVDPIEKLEQAMKELNNNIRKFFSPLLGSVLDFMGGLVLFVTQIGFMISTMHNVIGKDLIGFLSKGGLGKFIMEGPLGGFFKGFAREMKQTGSVISAVSRGMLGQIKSSESLTKAFGPFLKGFGRAKAAGASESAALLRGLSGQFQSIMYGPVGKVFQKALGPAILLLGGIKGAMEAEDANRTKTEGFLLGALTGGAKTGSFITGKYGDEAGTLDKALGVVGGAAWGAAAGAAIGSVVPVVGTGFGAFIGAIVGGVMEMVKIITDGTDILADLFAPFQAIGDWLSGIFGDLWSMLKSFATLNPVTIVGSLISGIFGIITKTIYAFFATIFGIIRAVVIGLPKLILRVLSLIWDIPKMLFDSIKSALAGLANNEWFGPIFASLSYAFNDIYEGFMAVWTPISEVFSGLFTVFSDLGKALFGASEGCSVLSGIMWTLQKAVWLLSYVISWLLLPVMAVAKALGFLLWIVGKTVQGIIYPFQYLYDVLVGHSIIPDLVFGIIKFFAMLPFRVLKGLLMFNVMIVKSFLKIPMLIWDGISTALGWIKSGLLQSFEYAKSIFSPKAWLKWISGLGTYVYDGFKSALQGVWDWIKSWIPGLKSATEGFSESAKEQEETRKKAGNSLAHAAGGLVGAGGSLLKGNLSEAGGKAWSATKETAGAAWDGVKAVGSYLNPFSYFKEGTKKIEKPGLAMLHAGEMVVPKNMVEKIAAMGSGVFGSISSFVRGKAGGEPGYKGLIGSIGEKIKGLGGVFKSCCPKDAVEGASEAVSGIPDAVAEAMGEVDDKSLFGRLKKQFTKATSYTNKFFKPLTTGFVRARKRGEGFFTSIQKGLKAQYMDATSGGAGGPLSQGMDWIRKSIFGESEGKDTKKGIFQRIKDGIFGSKEGDDTKQGILGIVKEGLFGSDDGVKKGLLDIAKKGIFGSEGEGGGLFGWFKGKLFGEKMKDGEMGPPKPGLVDAAKNTAKSAWEGIKERLEINTEEGMVNGAKNAAKKMYGKAKEKVSDLYGKAKGKLFGEKMKDGEMGPPKPGLVGKVKGRVTDLYGKAKDKLFGKGPAEAVEAAGKADSKAAGKLESFKEKMKNIAEGIKEFSGTKVLAGALNLIPASVGLVAMIPGSFGAKMLQSIDGERLKTALNGLAEGVSSLGKAKVLAGAGAMLLVGVASLGLIPAIPMFAILGAIAPLVEGGLKALGRGLTALGEAAANPYTWLGVLLLAAINVALIPLAYALSLLAPLVEAFGKALKYAFEGLGSVIKSAAEGITMILKEVTPARAVGLFAVAAGMVALGAAMAAFAAGKFVASWINFFSGDGLMNQIMMLGLIGPNLLMAAQGVDMLSKSFKSFAANKGGGWAEWFRGSDGVVEGFKKLSTIGTPEFVATAEAIDKMGNGIVKVQSATGATATATPATNSTGTAEAQPVHLRDITDTILRDRAGSGGSKLQSDELSRMEEASYTQIDKLEQIRQGINDLVSLMRPKGGGVVGESGGMPAGHTKDPKRPMHAARYGKMKFGVPGGLANRTVVNTGEV